MATMPTLRDMLKTGAHFGHKTSRWNPGMAKYIFTAKSGVHVINLEETAKKLAEAVDFLKKASNEGMTIVLVGTKKQASELVKKAALECGAAYVNFRWIGGTITNFDVVKGSISKFKVDKAKVLTGSCDDLSKRDFSKLQENVKKGERVFGGLVDMNKKPDLLVLIGAHDEKNALKEARAAGIKTVAIVDTNTNPDLIDYPVPANDDATKSIELFVNLFAQVIKENKKPVEKKEETK